MKECRRIPIRIWSAVGLLLILMMPGVAWARVAGLAYATDPATGYALAGNDPLSYFLTGAPEPGSERHEYDWGGVTWVFRNEGNLQAFAADPDVYAPQFTGCDPYALADGYASAGSPLIFAVLGERLYLFHSEVNRFLFLADATRLLKTATSAAGGLKCEVE